FDASRPQAVKDVSSRRGRVQTAGPIFRKKAADHFSFEKQAGRITAVGLIKTSLNCKSRASRQGDETHCYRRTVKRKHVCAAKRILLAGKCIFGELSGPFITCKRRTSFSFPAVGFNFEKSRHGTFESLTEGVAFVSNVAQFLQAPPVPGKPFAPVRAHLTIHVFIKGGANFEDGSAKMIQKSPGCFPLRQGSDYG